jgi:hypothetical protein
MIKTVAADNVAVISVQVQVQLSSFYCDGSQRSL